jgi:hypothetical protein
MSRMTRSERNLTEALLIGVMKMQYIFSRPEIAAIVMGCLIPMVIASMGIWAKVRKNRDNNELKQSMLDKGMSADEIEKVMNAGSI